MDIIENILSQLKHGDYSLLTGLVSGVIMIFVTNKSIDKYKIRKGYKPKNIKKVVLPPEIECKFKQAEFSQIDNEKIRKLLERFTKIMMKNCSFEDLTILFNNINTLKIHCKSFKILNLIFNTNYAGEYNTITNTININDEEIKKDIFHELLHMASSFYKNGVVFSGFSQLRFSSIGDGLNEGYTELLCRRYFVKDEVEDSYKYLTFVSKKLEKIVGKDKMLSLYLNANLFGLINDLKEYATEEEIMCFIKNTDFIYKYLDKEKAELALKNMLVESIKEINEFLVKVYFKKLLIQLNASKITYEQFISNMLKYINSLTTPVTIKGKKYNISTQEDLLIILKSLEEVFFNRASVLR